MLLGNRLQPALAASQGHRRRANQPTTEQPAAHVCKPYHVADNSVFPYRLALHAVLHQRLAVDPV